MLKFKILNLDCRWWLNYTLPYLVSQFVQFSPKAFWRIIATTIRDQEAELAPGRFRNDLYYRLNIMPGPVNTNEIATAGIRQ
jgi:sigma54-dependent transcription regulator